MGLLRLGAATVALVLLLFPTGWAAPAQGNVDFVGEARFPDGVNLTAPAADLLWQGDGVPGLSLKAASVTVERVGSKSVTHVTPLGPGIALDSGSIDERASHGASTLRLSPGNGSQYVLFRVRGEVDGGVGNSTLRPVAHVVLGKLNGFAGACAFNTCEDGTTCARLTCAEARNAYELVPPEEPLGGRATLAGDLVLYVYGPTLTVEDGAARAYPSGPTERRDAATVTDERAWLVVTLAGAQATLEDASAMRWYAPQPELRAQRVSAEEAVGSLNVGARQYRASHDALEARGALVIAPAPLSLSLEKASDQVGAAAYGETFQASVGGDVASINLRATSVFADEAAATAAAGGLAILAIGGAALAYWWPLVQFHATALLVTPLYSRLKKPEILDNDVRNHIYEIIRGNPGISARAVHRLSAQSWGTVVYHLRQLERHHLVVSRAVGRTRNYYENHGKYRGMEVPLACLQSERARTLARIVLDHPGITQEELAVASGFPQPTTSYYVRKLKAAGLVGEQREGRYVRYQPLGDLARYMQLGEDGVPTTLPPAPA